MSLLQRKPDERRRQHATPSSSGATASSANNIILKPTAPSTGTVPTNKHDDREEALRKSSPAKERKKHKGSAATDQIDTVFDDVIGRKVVRGALDVASAPVPAFLKPKTKAKEGEGQSEERVGVHTDLGAVVDAIRVVPSVEGRKGESDGQRRS